ncbi:AbrB/MazE/SpoVT family DNA-binding domain-containing protein [Endozoicomonas sp. Mp262]|uniref:AbrB/MazE/SpoVT family DNA-binding domain-containing protein n=1 Tax=Endozoicomonas sp. Mp262 TaxID=2919499 RepID=UPI0021D805C5
MSTSSVTSKGQVTIPNALRQKFQIHPGDKVLFEEKEGVITLVPMNNDIEALAGCLANNTNGQQATLDDMEEAIKTGSAVSWQDDETDDNGRN